MKKKFITKKSNNKFLFIMLLFILGLYIGYNYLDNYSRKINNKELVNLLLHESNHNNSYNNKLFNKMFSIFNKKPVSIINTNYHNLVPSKKISKVKKIVYKKEPIIYIYNTHQTEEYSLNNNLVHNVKPTVMMNNYILQDVFNKNNHPTIVEERKVKDILNIHKWNYSYSYKASRILMEDSYDKNKSLKYFIDVHRDSISKDKTTININNKSYAKILFIVGLENRNYKNNLEFTTKINNIINNKYPKLSRGIYKKRGPRVNGIYNQDFSSNTILVEIGGKDNTVDEVLNTALAFSECFMEVISNNEG